MEVEVKSTSQAPPTPVEEAQGHSQEDAREIPNLGGLKNWKQNWGEHGSVASGRVLASTPHAIAERQRRPRSPLSGTLGCLAWALPGWQALPRQTGRDTALIDAHVPLWN